MNKKMLALFGLKYNPFSPEIPAEALFVSSAIESFCWRIEHQIGEGGFACVTGDPGTGKSAALRILARRLGDLGDVTVGVLTRPQALLADFYREMGDLFGVALSPHNRWAGAKVLRETWRSHIESSLYRPVLLIDEAQDMQSAVLNELRFLSSAELDSRSILTVILAGDSRLTRKLQHADLLPIGSRIRTRLRTEYSTPQNLRESLMHVLRVITAPKVLLDSGKDRNRLSQTVEHLRPTLLVLDPFIRLHRIDENASREVAPILAYLRELQRRFSMAIVLVHHTRKGAAPQRAGQALRGSSDLHGWGDSNLYLRRSADRLTLTTEHRAAPSRDAIRLHLTGDDPAPSSTTGKGTCCVPTALLFPFPILL